MKKWRNPGIGLLILLAVGTLAFSLWGRLPAATEPAEGVQVEAATKETGQASVEVEWTAEEPMEWPAVKIGQPVTWRNRLPEPAIMMIGDGEYASGVLLEDQAADYTFALPGTYSVTLTRPDGSLIRSEMMEVLP